MNKVIFSGIQPSGDLHIGNYIGAVKQWVELQNSKSEYQNPKQIKNPNDQNQISFENSNLFRASKFDIRAYENELIFCIVDLHAITVPQDPKVLREKILETAAIYLASGIDPEKAHIFVQSENPDHTYLTWILDCITPFGQMNRMTQFKEKSDKQKENTTVGLFNYPVLMASDILLYQTDEVPVGEDQVQHVELTRDLAEKFNKTYEEVFKLPKVKIVKETARIMSLQNPLSKMSKSEANPLSRVHLLDTKDEIIEKIKKAVTDSGLEIIAREDKPAISNLLSIYSAISGKSIKQIEEDYQSKNYGEFKSDLGEALASFLAPIQTKYKEIIENPEYLNKVLDEGINYAISKSSQTIKKVNEVVGLGRS